MRWMTLISSAILILALNTLLLLGATFPDADSIRPTLNGVIVVFEVALLVSSGLLGSWYWRIGPRWLGVVFGGNIAVSAFGMIFRLAGGVFPALVLFGADLYWLNLYLVCLARDFDRLGRIGD